MDSIEPLLRTRPDPYRLDIAWRDHEQPKNFDGWQAVFQIFFKYSKIQVFYKKLP